MYIYICISIIYINGIEKGKINNTNRVKKIIIIHNIIIKYIYITHTHMYTAQQTTSLYSIKTTCT